MDAYKSASSESAGRIGNHLKGGVKNYLEHWQEWIVPIALVGVVAFISLTCCVFPFFFVAGPITCGLYYCALNAACNNPIDKGQLKRGWDTAGSSIIASLFINIVAMLPMLVIYGGFFAVMLAIAALAPPPNTSSQPNVDDAEVATSASHEEEPTSEGDATDEDRADKNWQSSRSEEAPPPLFMFLAILMMLVFYAVLFVMIILFVIWQLWFTTRMMFVLPLIADREVGFVEALRQSWSETRTGFWELLVINLAASFICMLGAYVLYVGMIFTIPIGMTIVTSAYRERFPASAENAAE